MSSDLFVVGLSRMAYGETLALQRTLAEARIAGRVTNDMLLLVEHPPVVTLGRSFEKRNLRTPPEELAARGIELFDIERGGDVTFHGPGQLVGYPIYDLNEHKPDLHLFLRKIEECLIRTLRESGVAGRRREGLTEVASIGLTEEQCREQSLDYQVGRFPFTANGRARATIETDGFVKIIRDKKYGEILGAHIVASHASELIHELAVARQSEYTVEEIDLAVHAHPTLSEAIAEAALDSLGRVVHT